jgi:NitT/TauT family transport system permease protein
MARAVTKARGSASDGTIVVAQILLAVVLIGLWEWAGRTYGSTWCSLPSLVAVRLVEWARTDLLHHIRITLTEIVIGLSIGGVAGVVVGLALGNSLVLGKVFRPIVVGFYSVPIITLAPLIILWFGLDLAPKIVLVTLSSFFLLFFNTFSGVQAIDRDLVTSMRLMGSSNTEEFRKIIAPGAMSWIISGVKIALPYAFAAAVTGELLASRDGMGSLLSKAAAQFDMTGLYAALVVLMVMGIVTSALASGLERWLLRWRHTTG